MRASTETSSRERCTFVGQLFREALSASRAAARRRDASATMSSARRQAGPFRP